MKRFNPLNSPFLRRAGFGFVFLLCCAAVALAWFAPPQSAFAFLTGGENSKPKQTAVSPEDKSDAPQKTSVSNRQRDDKENSQDPVWREVQLDSLNMSISEGVPETARALELNSKALTKILNSAPNDSAEKLIDLSDSQAILQLPMPDGGFMRFHLADSPVMEASMVEKFPEIKSYRAQGIDDLRVSARISFSPRGLHATILTHDKLISIHPAQNEDVNHYVSYYGENFKAAPFSCGVTESIERPNKPVDLVMEDAAAPSIATGATLRTYRFAVATTQEYYNNDQLGGDSYNNTVASINGWVSAVNLIYERELAIRLLAFTNERIVFTQEPDGLTNGNAGTMHVEIQDILANANNVGLANFDIGHVLGSGGNGGVAVLNSTCRTDKLKGGGASGVNAPIGNAGGLYVFAHELGHQFGAPHTWNACAGKGGRSNTSSHEVGSGSTIMGYGGTCRADQNLPASDNLLGETDARFHAISLKNINDHINSENQCAVSVNTNNAAPVVDAGAGYTIPKLTPFALTASATDANDDVKNLTYTWEQFDAGGALYPNPPYGDQDSDPETTTRPIFRAYSPTSNPIRIFPSLTYILNNANNPPQTVRVGTEDRQVGEKLPSVARKLKFRVTARDNRSGGGGTNDDDVTLTVAGNAGPFAVTAPNTSVVWTGGTTQTVTWDVNNTNIAPVSAANVKISLSTDGGQTFPTVLKASVPNDGSETVTVPNGIQTATARVKIEAIGNIFFDISDANLTINNADSCPIISGIAPSAGNVGTEVVITGTGFNGVTSVAFSGGANAPILTGRTDTQIKVNVPAGATSGAITLTEPGCSSRRTAPFSVCAGSPQELKLDSGISNAGYTDAYHANLLTPTNYPATLTHVQIYFGNNNATVGEQLTILVGTNTDGDTNINNTAFQQLAVTVQQVGQYNTYALPAPITITQSGDFVVGYKLTTNRSGAADNTAPKSRSYYSGDGVHFSLTTGTNYMIRGQYSTNCAAPTTISPAAQEFNASAGNGSIAVTASTAWTATSNAPSWITISSGASGANNGTVVYAVAQNNTGATRTGTITVAGQTFTVTQTACAIGFTPSPNTTIGAAGGTFDISVFAPAGCSWTATSNTSWITVNSGASGTNNGTISYSVQANIEKTARTGTITIGGQTLTVTQTACPDSATMIFDNEAVSFTSSGTYFVSRLTPTSYPATLTDAQIFLHAGIPDNVNIEIVAGKNTDGDANINGSIQQTVAVNTGTGRNAYKTFALTTPITITTGDFVIGFKIASGIAGFPISIETAAPTYGRGYRSFDNGATFAAAPANEDFKIRGIYKSFCTDGTISPTSQAVSGGGASGAVNVTASGAWSAHSNDAWITINSGASGTGNGTVNYTVAQNNTGATRTGTITVAGQIFTVTQNACFVTFAPGNATVSSGGGNFTISVPAGCTSWTARSKNEDWITVTSGASGTGAGTVGYKVAVNNTTKVRTGTITIADQTFTVTQNACPDSTLMKYDTEGNTSTATGGFNVVRLTPASYPASLTHVQVYLNDTWGTTGRNFKILAGRNEDGDENISGSIEQTVNVNSGTERGKYVSFQLTKPISISRGDFVVGFDVPTGGGFDPITFGTNPTPARRSYWWNGATFVHDVNVDYKIRGNYQSSCQSDEVKAESPPTFNNSGGTGTVRVAAQSAFMAPGAWTAQSNDPWIIITNVTNSANGDSNYIVASNGVVSYLVFPNDTGEPRTGSITIAGQIFLIYQAGSGRSIAGTIRYGINDTKNVYGVTLLADGSTDFSSETSLSGAYLLPGLTEEDNYTVTPSKTTDVNGITPFDATLVLRCIAAGAGCALDANQKIAADTNGSNTITPFDATQILRFVAAAGQNAGTGKAGTWKFELPSRTYNNLTTDPTEQDYSAFLIGDVNGSWQPPGDLASAASVVQETVQKQYLQEVELSFSGKAGKQTGNTETIPVSLINRSGAHISSFSFTVAYNEKIPQPLVFAVETAGTLSEDCSVTVNADIPGRIGIAGACPKTIAVAAGNLLNLRSTARSIRSKGDRSQPEFTFSETPVIEDDKGNLISIAKTN